MARKNLSSVNLSWTYRLAEVTGLDFEAISKVVGGLEKQLRGEDAKFYPGGDVELGWGQRGAASGNN